MHRRAAKALARLRIYAFTQFRKSLRCSHTYREDVADGPGQILDWFPSFIKLYFRYADKLLKGENQSSQILVHSLAEKLRVHVYGIR